MEVQPTFQKANKIFHLTFTEYITELSLDCSSSKTDLKNVCIWFSYSKEHEYFQAFVKKGNPRLNGGCLDNMLNKLHENVFICTYR